MEHSECARGTILIVDDDSFILKAVERCLSSAGFSVQVCDDWTTVASLVRTSCPDVVLMDYNMPAIKGDDLCAILKRNALSTSMRVVLYSSEDEMFLHDTAQRCGADGVIHKSTPSEELPARLAAHIA